MFLSEGQTISLEEVWIKAEPIDTESTHNFYIKCEEEISIDDSNPLTLTCSKEEFVCVKPEITLEEYEIISSENKQQQLPISTQRNARENQRKHTGQKSFTHSCDECGKLFPNKARLSRHILSHTGEKPFACDECGMRFAQKCHVKPHKLTHSDERQFECDVCSNKFQYKARLTQHKKLHDARLTRTEKPERPNPIDKMFSCDECGARFGYKLHLTIHQRIHTGKKSHSCECGKTFAEESKLRIHKRSHTGEKPFACDECGLRFSQKCHIKPHKLTHSDDRPFECDECGLRFVSKTALKKHDKQHVAERIAELEYIRHHGKLIAGAQTLADAE